MIYLQIQSSLQLLSVPRSDGHKKAAPGAMKLTLSRGGSTVVFGDLLDLSVNSMYYILEIEDASTLFTGEYDYTLTDADGEVCSVGILTAGDYVRTVEEVPGNRKIIEYGE